MFKEENRRIYIELNNKCNLKCNFCPYPYIKEEKKELDIKKLQELLLDIKANIKYRIIYFHNINEPFLYTNITELIEFCDAEDITYGITTNGLLLNKYLNVISSCKAQQINFSYQTPNEKQHKERNINIGLNEYREIIVENIKSLQSNGFVGDLKIKLLTTDINSTFCGSKIHGIDKVEEFIDEINKIVLLLNEKSLSIDQINKIKKVDISKHCKIKIKENTYIESFPFLTWGNYYESVHRAFLGKCDGGVGQILIKADGIVTPCCYDFNGDLPLGDINKNKLSEIMSSQNTLEILNKINSDFIHFSRCRFCLGNRSLSRNILQHINYLCNKKANERFIMSRNIVEI